MPDLTTTDTNHADIHGELSVARSVKTAIVENYEVLKRSLGDATASEALRSANNRLRTVEAIHRVFHPRSDAA